MFFDEQNVKKIAQFIHNAEISNFENSYISERLKLSVEILNNIRTNPQEWDAKCQFNIEHVGEQLIKWITEFSKNSPLIVNHIYVIAYRFLCEFDFYIAAGRELSMELASVKRAIEGDKHEMEGDLASQIQYASYTMPVNIAKQVLNDPRINVFKDFEAKLDEANKLKEKWDIEIENKTKTVSDLKVKLEGYKTGFNFVGLYQGFSDLSDKKIKEISWSFGFLIALACSIILPLFIEFILAVNIISNDGSFGIEKLYVLIPLFSMEVILIYFFRVTLFNHRSIKAQLMQLELRQTLCQFIQSYTEYSKEIKKDDNAALEKFENIIFSGVISNSEKLPSTFDGLEQISKLLKSVKG
ncbi:MAG: hypothetical protein JKY55_13450 [Aliivibrio sp.]|uniref:hypothetical protein n=1 Tax=Aliivibrio sp. TaxID=1872443 RepID=UPI001A452600|nr:hypothetical protein [Aliivibrio sp.]